MRVRTNKTIHGRSKKLWMWFDETTIRPRTAGGLFLSILVFPRRGGLWKNLSEYIPTLGEPPTVESTQHGCAVEVHSQVLTVRLAHGLHLNSNERFREYALRRRKCKKLKPRNWVAAIFMCPSAWSCDQLPLFRVYGLYVSFRAVSGTTLPPRAPHYLTE